ncbi:hypothetical protein HK098_006256 [Nowakowskiella sp. JEL0407]|nr:hypothetical protein HK098_006256 [Nowakowskiella sp. JEL0407]
MFDEIRDLINQFKKAVEHLERMRNKYEQADKDRASALVAYNKANADINATKKDVERLRQESERRTAMALNAMEDYTKCIAETNELKNKHYTELLPAVLDKFQTDDETERIDFARTHLMKYAEICLTQIPTETQSLESMKATFNTINSQYDSELFIKMMRTGCEIPPDYEFQQKALVGAISPKKPSSSFGKTLTKSPSKLTPDDNIEDAILAIPGNKGKKKANERIKVLDKEVIECEKKLHGLESMMEHKKLKSEGEREHLDQELQEQQAKLQQKRESLLQKREKLRLFISGIDGSSYISQTRSPDETSSISQTESFSSSISSSSPSRSTNLDTKLKSPPLRTLSRQDEEDEVEKVTNWDAKSQSKKSSDTSSKKSGETVGTKSLTATPSFSGGAPPPPPPMPMFLSNAAIPDNGALAIKKAKRVMAQVLYDFDAEPDTEEMGVKTGDVLEILEKQDDGWWRAKFENENGDEVEGLVPGNYLEEI